MKKYNLDELRGKKIKARNGNIGKYARWQATASGILVWLEDDNGHVVGSIKLSDIKEFEKE